MLLLVVVYMLRTGTGHFYLGSLAPYQEGKLPRVFATCPWVSVRVKGMGITEGVIKSSLTTKPYQASAGRSESQEGESF